MNLKNFKRLIEAKNNTGVKLPTKSGEFGLLIKEAIENIAMSTIPIDLTSEDLKKPALRFLNAGKFIRVPDIPKLDEDKIDIDEELINAVMYEFLANNLADLSKTRFYFMKRNEVIKNYEWNNYNLFEELKLK